MTLEQISAFLTLILSCIIFYHSRRNKNRFLDNEANRCLGNRCEIDSSQDFNNGRYVIGTALLRNKKTGELKFINQAKLSRLELLD